MTTAQDLRDGLARALVRGTGEGPNAPSGLHAALAAGDVMELKEPLCLAGHEAAGAGHTLAAVLDAWETLVVETAVGLHVAMRGAAWLAQGYAEARMRRDGASLRQATDSLASRKAELSALHR